jgi:hypothetical protein
MADDNDNRRYDEKQERHLYSSHRYGSLDLIEILIEQIFHIRRPAFLASLRS